MSGFSAAYTAEIRRMSASSRAGFRLRRFMSRPIHRKPSAFSSGPYDPRGESMTTSKSRSRRNLAKASRKLYRYQSVLAKKMTFTTTVFRASDSQPRLQRIDHGQARSVAQRMRRNDAGIPPWHDSVDFVLSILYFRKTVDLIDSDRVAVADRAILRRPIQATVASNNCA